MFDTFLEPGWKMKIFDNDPKSICSKIENLVQNVPKLKIFVFQGRKILSMGNLLLEEGKFQTIKILNFIEVKLVQDGKISRFNHQILL